METVLSKIVEAKRGWIAARKLEQPLTAFIDEIQPSDRCFEAAFDSKNTQFIFECKKASPSKGIIRQDFNLDEIAQAYRPYAAAISVLTDEEFFQGSFDYIRQVRQQVDCPVLCKDFMIDRYQVYLARYHQADAILLMLSVLDDVTYIELSKLAKSLNLGVLTEVSNESELKRALSLDAKVIGINNRNLRDLSIDLQTTKRLAPLIPKDRIVISESGIYRHQQMRDLSRDVDGFLIGSSLMAEKNLDHAVRQMVFGDIKVCGITNLDDALEVKKMGANYAGLIFVPQSPRCISIEQAILIYQGVQQNYVGVFQNQTLEWVLEIALTLSLSAVQLHGDEDQSFIDSLRGRLPESTQIWKAFSLIEGLAPFELKVDRFLLDSCLGEKRGGTGLIFDWSQIPDLYKDKVMIAGGLNASNAKQACAQRCLGLDFNSGVEVVVGKKDAEQLAAVFSVLRDY